MSRARKLRRARPCAHATSTGGQCGHLTKNPDGDCGRHKRAWLVTSGGDAYRTGRVSDEALLQATREDLGGGRVFAPEELQHEPLSDDTKIRMSNVSSEIKKTVAELNEALSFFDEVSERLAGTSDRRNRQEWLIGRDWTYTEDDESGTVVLPDLAGLEPEKFADQIRSEAQRRRDRDEPISDLRHWANSLVVLNLKCQKARDLAGPWPHSPSLMLEYWQPLTAAAANI